MKYVKPLYDNETVETVDVMSVSNGQIEQDEENTNASSSLKELLDKLNNISLATPSTLYLIHSGPQMPFILLFKMVILQGVPLPCIL